MFKENNVTLDLTPPPPLALLQLLKFIKIGAYGQMFLQLYNGIFIIIQND